MKYKIYFVVSSLILFLALNAIGQNIELTNATIEHNDAQRPCVQVTMKAPAPKPVKKAWEDFMDDEYDVNMKGIGFLSNKDILTAEKVQISALSEKQVNFYTQIVESGSSTKMCVFSSFGYDIYVNQDEYPEAYETMQQMTAQFLRTFLPEYYTEQIEVSQEKVTDLRDEVSDLEESLADNEEEIRKLQEENDELRKQLTEQKNQLRKAEQVLNTQQDDFEEVQADLSAIEN